MRHCRDNRCHLCGDPWTGGMLPESVAPDPIGPYEVMARYDDYDPFWPDPKEDE